MEQEIENGLQMNELQDLFSRLTLEECQMVIEYTQAILDEKGESVA